MSMNVGDSSDLIHGGGGGLGVFWRSRTEFEKKLLVAIVVMVLIIISLVIAVAVVAAQNNENSSSGSSNTTTKMSNFEELAKDKMQTRILGVEDISKESQESPSFYGPHQPTVAKTETSPTASPDSTMFRFTNTYESSARDRVIGYNDAATEDSSLLNEKIHVPVLYPTPA